MILCLKTSTPEAELYLLENQQEVGQYKWHAHRELSESLTEKIESLLAKHQLSLADLKGIVVFRGPGSFTGLRIGISVANALGYVLGIPVVGSQEEDWLKSGIEGVVSGSANSTVLPEYGAAPHITKQKK